MQGCKVSISCTPKLLKLTYLRNNSKKCSYFYIKTSGAFIS